MKKYLSSFAAIAAALAMVGCQTGTTNGLNHKAVACDKCKAVWVRITDGAGVTTFNTAKRPPCRECSAVVERYFDTGVFNSTCNACRGELRHCTHQ